MFLETKVIAQQFISPRAQINNHSVRHYISVCNHIMSNKLEQSQNKTKGAPLHDIMNSLYQNYI